MTAGTRPARPATRKSTHPVDEVLPLPKLAAYGLQHVMAFYAGAALVPILLAGALQLTPAQLIHLINADLFTCGIASIIQAVGFWKIGVRLPLLQGVTFTAVSPMIAIGTAVGGGTEGLVTIYGSVIVAGLFTFLAAPFFARLVKYFPPVVTGSVILIIGIALLPVAAGDVVRSFGPQDLRGNGMYTKLADGTFALQPAVQLKDIGYALGTLLVIVIVQRFFKGFMATVAVLIGLVVGTLVAWAAGDADFSDVAGSDWLGYTAPFHFGTPKFVLTAILSMVVVMIITMVETTGDVYATGEIVGKRIKGDDIARAIRADGLATTLGGVLNSFPYTCFAENVGLVRLTQIKSRWVVVAAGIIMIILGSLPKAAAIVAGVPSPVLGGAALAMFAAVAVVGIQTLQRVDFNDHRNIVIVGTSVGLGMLVTAQPYISSAFPKWAQIFFGSGITLGAILAIVLNVVFHHLGGSRGPAVAGRPGASLVKLADVNAMTREQFSTTFSAVVQNNTWALARAYALKPFADTFALRMAFQEALLGATDAEQRHLMDSFPDLGSVDTAGNESAVDHAGGLNLLAEEDHGEIRRIAMAYRERYGIPWIVCARDVENYTRLIENGWARMNNAPSVERAAALVEISKIFNHRFDDLIADANPFSSARPDNLPPLSGA